MDGLGGVLSSRALRAGDAVAVAELMAECERADLGEVMIEVDDIVSDWRRPSFELAADTVGVFDGARLLAYGEVYRGRRAEVYVRPEARGRGARAVRAGRDAGAADVRALRPGARHRRRLAWTRWGSS
jgi:mycothiol synthase